MLYAVTHDRFDAIFFVCDRPENSRWTVVEGVELEVPATYRDSSPEPDGAELDDPGQMLAESTTRPNSYKVFARQRYIDPARYRMTEFRFGGVFTRSTWEGYEEFLREQISRDPSSYPLRGAALEASPVGRDA